MKVFVVFYETKYVQSTYIFETCNGKVKWVIGIEFSLSWVYNAAKWNQLHVINQTSHFKSDYNLTFY